jgi:hypothetical protein
VEGEVDFFATPLLDLPLVELPFLGAAAVVFVFAVEEDDDVESGALGALNA